MISFVVIKQTIVLLIIIHYFREARGVKLRGQLTKFKLKRRYAINQTLHLTNYYVKINCILPKIVEYRDYLLKRKSAEKLEFTVFYIKYKLRPKNNKKEIAGV